MKKIIDIRWERVNLRFAFEGALSGDVFIKSETGKIYPLDMKGNTASLNVTNLSGEMMTEGSWYIYADNEPVNIEASLINRLDDFSRVFRYREFYAFITELFLDDEMHLYINASYMMRNRKPRKNYRFAEKKGVKGKLLVLFKLLFSFMINAFYRFVRLFRSKGERSVLFFSENDNEPRGNLKAFYEYLSGRDNIKIRTSFFNRYDGADIRDMAKAVVNVALSDIIIVDNYVSFLNIINLAPEQKLVQLWHAGVGFKSVGYARFGKDGGGHPFRSSHRKYTTAIVDDERLVDIYKEVFAADERIFKVLGMPRLDGYLSAEKLINTEMRLLSEYSFLRNKRIILFSPTYRGVTAADAYYDYSLLDLGEIYNFCKANDFVFVIKMHPFVRIPINIPEEYTSCIIDLSEDDINDLICISDIMITDYSSCAYEFSFFNRPLVFFRFDKEAYEYERPVHTLDMFTAQQYEVKTFRDMMRILGALRNVDINKRFSDLRERQNDCCEKIAKEILG